MYVESGHSLFGYGKADVPPELGQDQSRVLIFENVMIFTYLVPRGSFYFATGKDKLRRILAEILPVSLSLNILGPFVVLQEGQHTARAGHGYALDLFFKCHC